MGLDARDGKVAVEGWAETSELTVLEIAKRFEDAGVAAIIYTDIARDGLLKGLNLEATIALAEAISHSGHRIGGARARLMIVRKLLEPRARPSFAGAIAGRALYDGRLDPCVEPLLALYPCITRQATWRRTDAQGPCSFPASM